MAKKKPWEELTRAERRVEICKDVIKWINAGACKPSGMSGYISGYIGRGYKQSEPIPQNLAEIIFKNCDYCARGAMLISRVSRFNKLSFENLGFCYDGLYAKREDTTEGLHGAFTRKQLDQIEAAYERCGYTDDNGRFTEKYRKFGEKFENATERLLAIMQNIVDHEGEFKPQVEYEILTS